MDNTNSKISSAANDLKSDAPKKDHVIPSYRKLNNGIEMPVIGLGSSRIQNIIDVAINVICNSLCG